MIKEGNKEAKEGSGDTKGEKEAKDELENVDGRGKGRKGSMLGKKGRQLSEGSTTEGSPTEGKDRVVNRKGSMSRKHSIEAAKMVTLDFGGEDEEEEEEDGAVLRFAWQQYCELMEQQASSYSPDGD